MMKVLIQALLSTLLAIWPMPSHSPQVAQSEDCLVDEAGRDPTFLQFRRELQRIIQMRDARQLLARVAPDVTLDEDTSGIPALVRLYEPNNRAGGFWPELGTILMLGGRFVGNDWFCAPFVSCPSPDTGGYMTWFVLRKNVPVFDRPAMNSAVIARLSCTYVQSEDPRMPAPDSPIDWIAIVRPGQRWGFMELKELRSSNDLHAEFKKQQGQWRLTAYIANH